VPLVDQAKTDVSQKHHAETGGGAPASLDATVANLAYLAPGVKMADSYDPTKNRYAVLSVNGQDGRNVNVNDQRPRQQGQHIGGTVMQVRSKPSKNSSSARSAFQQPMPFRRRRHQSHHQVRHKQLSWLSVRLFP